MVLDQEPFLPPLRWDGGGLTLRVYTAADAEALSVAASESYEHLKPWMPWASEHQSVPESEVIVRRLAGQYLEGKEFTLGAWEGTNYVGGTGFHMRCGPIEWRCAEVGMWIRSSYASQGWGTRVLEQMLEWGFTEWGWERLIWKCDTRNVGSSRVAEKCGLIREGTLRSDALDVDGNRRDTHLYAILREDWLRR